MLLAFLLQIGARPGNGYQGEEHPMTKFEKFGDMDMRLILNLLYQGKITEEQARLFVDSAEKSRAALEKYYGLKTTLHFHYRDLVCRTSLSGECT